jgi:hypothetical protein
MKIRPAVFRILFVRIDGRGELNRRSAELRMRLEKERVCGKGKKR